MVFFRNIGTAPMPKWLTMIYLELVYSYLKVAVLVSIHISLYLLIFTDFSFLQEHEDPKL